MRTLWLTEPAVTYVATVLYQKDKGGTDGAGMRQMLFMKDLLGPLDEKHYRSDPSQMTLLHVLTCRGQFELETM